MDIRLLDLTSPSECAAFYEHNRAAQLAENPDRPMWSKSEVFTHIREPIGEDAVAIAAFDDTGVLIGGAIVFYPLTDNVSMAFADVFVGPAHQRRGVGSALLDDVVARVSACGRSTLLTEATYSFERRDDHPYRHFAEKRGFSVASTEIARRLDLPVADGQLQAWIDEAAPKHEGYRIEAFRGVDIPVELLPSLCHALNRLAVDAPSGDIAFEMEQMTPELWLQRRERDMKRGLEAFQTVAVGPSGDVVAATVLGVPQDQPGIAHQWATIVLEEHRGHRLGLAIKARNLRALQEAFPDRTSIHTCNAEVNGPMIAINARIGFKPVELMVAFQRKLG
jgi:GNAT superfamily N-acetyltransferase